MIPGLFDQGYFLRIPPLTYLLVHFSFLGSRLSSSAFFLHLAEQNHKMEPLFLANMVPEPFATGLLQKLHGLTKRLVPVHLLDLLGFPFSLPQHQNLSCPDRSLDVSSENSSPVLAGKDLDANLNYFTCDSGTSDDLNYLGLYYFVGRGTHEAVAPPLILAIDETT